ncbi:1,4-dihydroxy-2-naphthoate polyprenyltransferase [Lacticaseibacillus sp. GG6-2]
MVKKTPLSAYLKLIEIRSKLISIFPCLTGTLYAYWRYHQVHLDLLVVYFIAMLLFNITEDTNMNYEDYKRAPEATVADYRRHVNIIGKAGLSLKAVQRFIAVMFLISAVLGVWLTVKTGWPLLVMGLFSFVVGYCYADGPYPLSKTPTGEFFSGFTMGFVIYLLAVYVNAFDVMTLDWRSVGQVLIASGILQATTANIMLANNIADEREDYTLGRKTILYYWHRSGAIRLFIGLYWLGIGSMSVAAFLGWLPRLTLLTLLSVPLVVQQARSFIAKPSKTETFIASVKINVILAGIQLVTMGLGIWLRI